MGLCDLRLRLLRRATLSSRWCLALKKTRKGRLAHGPEAQGLGGSGGGGSRLGGGGDGGLGGDGGGGLSGRQDLQGRVNGGGRALGVPGLGG